MAQRTFTGGQKLLLWTGLTIVLAAIASGFALLAYYQPFNALGEIESILFRCASGTATLAFALLTILAGVMALLSIEEALNKSSA